ncbi:TRAP transporter large permease [Sinanaerobacter chloroacetimidivorans]|jgi:C4-dicarboxylate transporter DctM subunit|uniref:TRAP transporter large permease n=1 Tax=Sinanaerobacter chloroacetimidivorans TaxID=2818044 RepID=A0A8J8B0S2_9FIRM|nr:TRAP transporter large permease [Sinanaerobacter chloroacetimidivorans]MBR0597459.1 TRAP transporter large permease [Sinanaerobacter chloroacetimidivorans]
MSMITVAVISVICLFTLILFGVHIGFSLSLMSFIGIWLMTEKIQIALSILATTSFEAIRDYTFAVIPLFVLMGCFMSQSGVAKDLFDAMNYFIKKLPGGLGIATVVSNAVFAAVTGVSVASAAVFARICLPEMSRHRYKPGFALGAVGGSSVLGMLIPPSLLMIVYGMLSETSIGKLFLAGIVPGLILAGIYCVGIIGMSIAKPELTGRAKNAGGKVISASVEEEATQNFLMVSLRALPIFIIVILVLGGIWGGFFTPTEASAVGAFATLILSVARGMRPKGLKKVLLETAGTTSSILFLLISAQMYSRMLTMSGATVALANMVQNSSLGAGIVLFMICFVLILLGCVLDSTSILLITVPLILPIAAAFGWNLIWLGIVMIIVIEMGLLTPPFGMVVFAMKATIGEGVEVEDIFKGVIPFLLMMAMAVVIIIAFPSLTTWLPSLQ